MEPLRLNTKSNLANISILLNLLNISTLLLVILIFTITSAHASQKKVIAITEIVEHPSLQRAKEGIIDALKDKATCVFYCRTFNLFHTTRKVFRAKA